MSSHLVSQGVLILFPPQQVEAKVWGLAIKMTLWAPSYHVQSSQGFHMHFIFEKKQPWKDSFTTWTRSTDQFFSNEIQCHAEVHWETSTSLMTSKQVLCSLKAWKLAFWSCSETWITVLFWRRDEASKQNLSYKTSLNL